MDPPDPFPEPAKAVTGKLGRVVTEPQVQVTMISKRIPDPMRDDLAGRPTGEVVIKRFEGLLTIHAAITIKQPQMFFLFGVPAEDRISLSLIAFA